MIDNNYEMDLGPVTLHYCPRDLDSVQWFQWHMKKSRTCTHNFIEIDDELLSKRLPLFREGTTNGFIEYRILAEPTGQALYERGMYLFHATAFIWNGLAWLFTARSGMGKTTQFLNWKKLWPDDVKILCGDMPVLGTNDMGEIYVYPSPWNGKERIGFENHESARLGGIVYLIQGEENKIRFFDIHKYIVPFWKQFIGHPETEEQIRSIERFLNNLFTHYPVWELTNKGDIESSVLTRKEIEKSVWGKNH